MLFSNAHNKNIKLIFFETNSFLNQKKIVSSRCCLENDIVINENNPIIGRILLLPVLRVNFTPEGEKTSVFPAVGNLPDFFPARKI
jgi:cell division inhibitor SulA